MATIESAHDSLRKIFADLASAEEAKVKALQVQGRAATLTLAEVGEQIRLKQEELVKLRDEEKAIAARVNQGQRLHDKLVSDGLAKKAQLIAEGEEAKASMIAGLDKALQSIKRGTA
jgi:hypothetical protein